MFETFGPVSRPFYSVRFNTAEEIDRERAKVGSRVFYVPSYKSALVQVEELKKMKYTDASNAFDEEVEEHEREFSDDEEELSYRQMLKRSTAKSNRQQQQPRQQRPRRAPLPPKDDDDDFDAALAAYDASKNTQSQAQSSGRQMVSYDEDL